MFTKIKFELSTYDKNLIKKKKIFLISQIYDERINKRLNEFKKRIKSRYEVISVFSNKDIQK